MIREKIEDAWIKLSSNHDCFKDFLFNCCAKEMKDETKIKVVDAIADYKDSKNLHNSLLMPPVGKSPQGLERNEILLTEYETLLKDSYQKSCDKGDRRTINDMIELIINFHQGQERLIRSTWKFE
jgi:hypothetical protein